MEGADAGSITLSFVIDASDYAQYAAVVKRRQQYQGRRANFIAFLAVFFSAIPVALIFRFFSRHLAPPIRDMIGWTSLLSFMFGAYAMVIAASLINRQTRKKALAENPVAFGARSVAFDSAGVALTSPKATARWQWAAIHGFTRERGMLLLWIGRASAVAIPVRSFENAGACEAAVAFIRARLTEARLPSPS